MSSWLTVLVALSANALLAVAKTVAALLSGSASMTAEAAHSWSDTGNEIFLLLAERRGSRPRDDAHPRGYGRATYTWSLVAAFGLFFAGAVLSVWHGVSALSSGGGEEGGFTLNYAVLGIGFVLEGSSFLQASRQVHGDARRFGAPALRYVARTSNATLRAVFFEDFSALLGLLIAGAGVGLHQATGEAAYDALGSIGVGLLLGVVAIFLIQRNMAYLVGQAPGPAIRREILRSVLERPEVDRVTYLHVEYVGPDRVFVVAAVDLVGDDREDHLAVRLRRVEAEIERDDRIEDAVLTVAPPDEPSLEL